MPVQRTKELERVLSLPVRDDYDQQALADELTEVLRTPNGTQKIWPLQAKALKEIFEARGGFCPIPVGNGKTLVTLLSPVICEPFAERPLLIVPAALRDETIAHKLPEIKQNWQTRDDLCIIGSSLLSSANHADFLDDYRPDMIWVDEAHQFRRTGVGRTRRLMRYLRQNEECKVVWLSGTMTNRSLMDYWHLLVTALDDKAPLPLSYAEAEDWASILDDRETPQHFLDVGALELFTQPEDGGNVRKAYQRRLHSTVGVIAGDPQAVGSSLVIRRTYPPVEPEIKDAIAQLEATWETPQGYALAEAMQISAVARQMAQGFHYYWDPEPPKEWMLARKEWARYVRERIRYNKKQIDTELQVVHECQDMPRPPQCYLDWTEIKGTYEPTTLADWFAPHQLEPAVEWIRSKKGIVWVEHNEVGNKLQSLTDMPYYGAGRDAAAKVIKRKGPMIASIRAHGTGRNLQHHHYRNLVLCPPGSGQTWEQLTGRTHRPGQKADEVEFWVWLHTPRLEEAFERARADAEYIEQTTGPRQKLASIATVI